MRVYFEQNMLLTVGYSVACGRGSSGSDNAHRIEHCRWNWLAEKGALYRGTLQATGRTTRILYRPKRVCADACYANSENQLASGSQKEQSFFSERSCDISVVSHQLGSPQLVAKTYTQTLPACGSLPSLAGEFMGKR